jgi:putative FmdB family regulatory protein
MPTYDYVCASCGHRLEIMHSVHAAGPSACPVCGGPMKKAIGAPAVHFKGSGWARKEKSSSATSRRAEPKEAAAGSGSSSDAAESAPAAAAPGAESVSKEPD